MRIERLGDGSPEVAVIGGIHGDEPCGVHAVETLIEQQPDVQRPVALVVANEEAISRNSRYVDTDLNRSFPGEVEADAHEDRLAHALSAELGDCETLALHSTQSYRDMFALVDEVDDFARRICPQLPVDAVVQTEPYTDGRIFASIPWTVEIECGYQGSDRAKDNAVKVTRAFLQAVDVLPGNSETCRESVEAFQLARPIEKDEADSYDVFVDNFERVEPGRAFAAVDERRIVADEPFYPVLLSAYGYDDLFGYAADRIGWIEA
jgi:succinylglutamate desuccinylase